MPARSIHRNEGPELAYSGPGKAIPGEKVRHAELISSFETECRGYFSHRASATDDALTKTEILMNPNRFFPYGIRNVRTRRELGRQYISGTLMREHRNVANVEYENGSDVVDITWIIPMEEFLLLQHLEQLPEGFFAQTPPDRESMQGHFLLQLLQLGQDVRWLKRWCEKQTMFRLRSDPDREWQSCQIVFSKQVADDLRRRWGDRLDCIANELPQVRGRSEKSKTSVPSALLSAA